MKCPRCKIEMVEYIQQLHDLYDFFDLNHLDWACSECQTVYPAQNTLKISKPPARRSTLGGRHMIDYGRGLTNIDLKTDIRYGVIPLHIVGQAWYEDAKPVYSKPHCPHCGNVLKKIPSEYVKGVCPHCKKQFESYDDDECQQLIGWRYDEKGYQAHQSDDSTDVWVTKSPYFTYCGHCSPCAPGAGYLTSEGDVKTYCFGHNWFESGKAPYRVYSVKTGKEVD